MYAKTNIIISYSATNNEAYATITTTLQNYSTLSIYQFVCKKKKLYMYIYIFETKVGHSHIDTA
jgi:hypothetical protein